MTMWPKDNSAARNRFYGDPERGEIAPQLVKVYPPFAMYYGTKRVKHIMFHRKAAAALRAALDEIWDYYGHDQAKVDAVGVSKYSGAYNHRSIRGRPGVWSNHAYGCAIDINAAENGMGTKGNMPQAVVDAFYRQGAKWGGDYQHRKDPMHFEFVDNGGRVPSTARSRVVNVAPPENTNIVATVFGGRADRNKSAYDEHIITDTEFGVALPAHLKTRPRVLVTNVHNRKSVVCDIVDVGPWNIDDPYWLTGARPQAESGRDRRGRTTNHAGIDLTPAAARAIGLDGKGLVNWSFVGSGAQPKKTGRVASAGAVITAGTAAGAGAHQAGAPPWVIAVVVGVVVAAAVALFVLKRKNIL